jgi:cation-transporting ATPase F
VGALDGATTAEARTAAVNVFVVVEAFYLFNCRSLTHSIWYVGVWSNRWILGGVLVQAAGQIAITYLPVMNTAFKTAPIDAPTWARILLIASIASTVVATDKWLRRRFTTRS